MDTAEMTLVAINAAQKAGELLRRGFGSKISYSTKSSENDFVTEYDYAAEGLILETIKSHYKNHLFLAEESGGNTDSSQNPLWIIDPIDGTTNFLRNIPLFSVSIGVCFQAEMLIGVIYQPLTHELFWAEKGKGAFLNGKKIEVSLEEDIKKCTLATGFPYNVDEKTTKALGSLNRVLEAGVRVRDLGSATIDCAYLAAGRFDGYWMIEPKPWDLAAGVLLIEEAGGKISTMDGSPFNLFQCQNILATNEKIHTPILNIWS